MPQREPREQVAGERREQERDRARDQQLVAEARKRLEIVLPGCSDDEDAAGYGNREQTRGIVETGHGGAVLVCRALDCGGVQQRSDPQRAGRVEHVSGPVEELREALARLDQAAAARRERSVFANEGREVVGSHLQRGVELGSEVGLESHVEEPAQRGEHDRHGNRKRGCYAQPDRQTAHAPSARSR